MPMPIAVPADDVIPFEPPDEPIGLPDEVREHLRRELEAARTSGAIRAGAVLLGAATSVEAFYAARDFHPAWFADGRLRRDAWRELVDAVQSASAHGLDPADYHLEELRAVPRSLRRAEPATFAAADLLLTESFVVLGAHLLNGKVDPVRIHPTWNASRKRRDILLELRRALDEGGVGAALEGLAPRDPRYVALRAELARHRAVAARGGLPELPEGVLLDAATAQPPQIVLLRRVLAALGDLPSDQARISRWDEPLVEAVRVFQARHGIEPSGAIDEATLAALRVPVEDRIAAIEANLERLRWLPEDLGARHLVVNIADFRLEAIENGRAVVAMRAVVGRPYRRTPVFSDAVRYAVFNPRWRVPRTIVEEDIVPEARADITAFARRNLRVLSPRGREVDPARIRWETIRPGAFPYVLEQPPGPNNALGAVKLVFPNPHDVYLHGTPRQDLFAEPERAFSSGCIRLERPLDVAAWLLADQPAVDRAALDAIVATGRTRTITLRRPVPVHILYLTSWASGGAEGSPARVQFRRDVYDRDPALLAALGRQRDEAIAAR